MFTLSQLFVYPVKSLRGIAVSRALAQERGLQFDRRWMIIDAQGQMLTQRKWGVLAQVETAIGQCLTLSRGADSVKIPLEMQGPRRDATVWHDTVSGVDCGDEAAQFLGEILRQNARLVWMDAAAQRAIPADFRRASESETTSFADAFPFLLLGEATLADLNDRILQNGGENRIEIERFRPNFVFSGGAALEEETWSEFSMGEAKFRAVKPCSRCVVVSLDPLSGEKTGAEPLKTLQTYRKIGAAVYLGQNALTLQSGEVKIGDEIRVGSWK